MTSGSGYGQGTQTDSSNQPGMVSKLASAVGLGGQSGSNQQSGTNQATSGYGSGSSGLTSGHNTGNTGRSEYSEGSNPPYGVQAGNVSSKPKIESAFDLQQVECKFSRGALASHPC